MEDAHCEVAVPTWRQRMREAALEAISPTRCAGCERPGALVCDDCIARITPIDPAHACTRCGAPFGDVLCTRGRWHLRGIRRAFRFACLRVCV